MLFYRIYQICIALPILLVCTILTALVTIIGSLIGGAHVWGYYPAHIWSRLVCIFSLVRIEPQPGPLRRLQGSVPHPKGSVSVDLRLGDDNLWHGMVSTPEDIPGILAINGQERSWNGGPLSF